MADAFASPGADEQVSLFVRQWLYEPRPSGYLLGFLLSSHAAALMVLFTVSWPLPWLPWGLALLVVVSAGYYGHIHFRQQRAIRQVCWREAGGWELWLDTGKALPVMLQPYSFYSFPLTVLCLKTRPALGARPYVFILLADNCAVAQRRHLLMRLKLS